MDDKVIEAYKEGCNFYYGQEGYPLDYGKALELFTKAAEGGVSNAMNNIGVMYLDGKGVPQDYAKAFDMFYKALNADNGNYLAYHNVARMYHNGFGVSKSFEKACECYTSAIQLNPTKNDSIYVNDCFNVGCIYTNQKRLREAFAYFEEAATKGNMPEAWHNMGYICSNKGIPGGTRKTSFPYFLKAAMLGYVPSMYEVGCIYISEMKYDEGIAWVEKAAARGYEPAVKNLKRFKAGRAAYRGSIFDYFG